MRIGILLLVYLALCVVALSSCSLEKRANRHIRKAISLDPSILEKDTVTIHDSVKFVTDRVELDSVFMISKDTVTIVKDNLTVRHFYRNDSVWIYAECDSTIQYVPFEVEVPIDRVVYRENSDWSPPNWMWLLIFLAGAWYGVDKYFKNKRKKSVDLN
jgi:hypothetical protein